MHDINIKNQAVKECLNGKTRQETSTKFGVHISTLNNWIVDYRNKMKQYETTPINSGYKKEKNNTKIALRSMNIDIDGNNVTITKDYLEKLLEIFKAFDE